MQTRIELKDLREIIGLRDAMTGTKRLNLLDEVSALRKAAAANENIILLDEAQIKLVNNVLKRAEINGTTEQKAKGANLQQSIQSKTKIVLAGRSPALTP